MSSAAAALFVLAQSGQGENPDRGTGIGIIVGVVVAIVVVMAIVAWLIGFARRRWSTGPGETHQAGDVGRVAGKDPGDPETGPG
jgi:hypothetical protein